MNNILSKNIEKVDSNLNIEVVTITLFELKLMKKTIFV